MTIFEKYERLTARKQFTPQDCHFTFDGDDEWSIARVFIGEIAVGHAYLTINGDCAKLDDIVLQASLPHWNQMLRRMPGTRVSYRGRGIGSIFLRRVLDWLRERGVRRVWGQIGGGDPVRQATWYRSHGFSVDTDTRRIERELLPQRSPALANGIAPHHRAKK